MKHTCAVCWKQQITHEDWHDHAEDEHGAEMDLFGFKTCLMDNHNKTRCPGVLNTAKLGKSAPVRHARDWKPKPITVDGETYVPSELPI